MTPAHSGIPTPELAPLDRILGRRVTLFTVERRPCRVCGTPTMDVLPGYRTPICRYEALCFPAEGGA